MVNIPLYCCALFLWISCNKKNHDVTRVSYQTDTPVIAFHPVPVQKTVNKKVFVHLMPWFETKQTNQPAGTWGQHWTMADRNPDITDARGDRQIASFYYPLIGPYSSGDTDVIEYQLLLMKFSGIDGVFIDWPGTLNLYDYAENAKNTETIISMLQEVGLNFAIVYEDQNINIAYHHQAISNKIAAAETDMHFLQTHFFNQKNYEHIDGKPVLLDFGPQTFMTEKDWTSIFSVLDPQPAFFTLWSLSADAGKNAVGEFAWINKDNLKSLHEFYDNNYRGMKIASAYPGFNPYYTAGGWSGPTFVIPSNGTENFQTTLDMALNSNASYIQLPTWNDYGEGTMLEPTDKFQYSLLTALQQSLGVGLTQSDLELVARFYDLRTKYIHNVWVQDQLNQVFYFMVSLQLSKAKDIMDHLQ
ncbi:MAG TPA: glycoside hydrolase family 71/99-like protein [Chitinophagaceae bacterium]|nr:glycoside hydrolase family 71/99-like protein [Chitinophagaceae bacterium]